jgi:hypothetical protein
MNPSEDTLREMTARMACQAKLLEVLYTILYRDTPQAFDAMCADLVNLTRTAPVKTGPISEEDAIDMGARMCVQFETFRGNVLGAIEVSHRPRGAPPEGRL